MFGRSDRVAELLCQRKGGEGGGKRSGGQLGFFDVALLIDSVVQFAIFGKQ